MPEEKKPQATHTAVEKPQSSGAKPKQSTAAKPSQSTAKSTSAESDTGKKLVCSLCYIWGILFFLPLIFYKNDRTATRHANAGLVLLLLSVIGNTVLGALSTVGWFFGLLAGVYSFLLLVIGVIGIIYVCTCTP